MSGGISTYTPERVKGVAGPNTCFATPKIYGNHITENGNRCFRFPAIQNDAFRKTKMPSLSLKGKRVRLKSSAICYAGQCGLIVADPEPHKIWYKFMPDLEAHLEHVIPIHTGEIDICEWEPAVLAWFHNDDPVKWESDFKIETFPRNSLSD